MKEDPTPGVKVLSESEIQQKLYGGYRAKRVQTPWSPPPPARNAEWSGQEILSGELQRLRSELIELRQEKDHLAQRLAQITPAFSPPQEQVVWISPSARRQGRNWGGRLVVALGVLGLVGYWMGGRILQASPMAGDPTPYTVQAAVYDGKTPAHLAVDYLSGFSYPAFLMELPRKNRQTRYRVCVGNFVTKEEANLERLRLLGDPRFPHFKDAFVRVR